MQGTKSLPSAEEGPEKDSVLGRSLRVLNALIQSPVALNLTEVARIAGQNVNTAKRILAELGEAGYVARSPDSRRFLPGPKALFPLPLYHPMNVFCRETFEVARQLRDSLGETISLIIFLGSERVVASLAPGRESLHPMYDTWLTTPLHGSPSGKILLASLDQGERDRLLGPGPYAAVAPRTITDPADLARELEAVRKKGVAVAVDETIGGITAVGAPISADGAPLGCLVAVGSTYRMATGSRLQIIEAELKKTALIVSSAAPSIRAIPYLTGVTPSGLRQLGSGSPAGQADE